MIVTDEHRRVTGLIRKLDLDRLTAIIRETPYAADVCVQISDSDHLAIARMAFYVEALVIADLCFDSAADAWSVKNIGLETSAITSRGQ